MDISERKFESLIESTLLGRVNSGQAAERLASFGLFQPGGYVKRSPEDYDKERCLIPADVISFIYATQPEEWKKFSDQHGKDAKEKLLERLSNEVASRGTIEVLRKGIKSSGCQFKLAYFRPNTRMNPDVQKKYDGNIFSVVRQLKYSIKNENSLDLTIFLNGLPIFTAELKNPLTLQTVQDAIKQYKLTRDYREPLFAFGRCIAHFAVDPDLVYVATHLRGAETEFLPFNQGRGTGAGNPIVEGGFATAYLWEKSWSRDSILDLIQNYVQIIELEDDKGRKTGEKRLIFPRYHQLDTVRRLVIESRSKKVGQRYLIQHSAGSGKSNSIAWLAYHLAYLHDESDKPVFDSVIVITDRRVLDRQLQRTIAQFQQVKGVLEKIDKHSRQLKKALEEGKKIIVTTLQKFPVIANQIGKLAGNRFAIIIDEAHSSQGGESTKSVKKVFASASLEDAEREEPGEEDLEDKIIAEMRTRGYLPNVSYYAFTATPKAETLQLFGTRQPDNSFAPFSLYSMRQAIEERFILDVLENYTTYRSYFSLLKKIEEDPRYDHKKATFLLKSFVDLHEHTINKKVEIIVEHFVNYVADKVAKKAKAMIVTRSRLHAVRYKLALDKYLKERNYTYKSIVAFSGTVEDPLDGEKYTESGMNSQTVGKQLAETATAATFKEDPYRFLVVAFKYQTGFDEPLLHTMYVDQLLKGVRAVQTLSRLNRFTPGKDETMVLDFVNKPDVIQEAFQPYYEKTVLEKQTDPDLLYNIQAQIESSQIYDKEDVEKFAKVWFNPKATQEKLHSILVPAVDRFRASTKEEQATFRSNLKDYVRLYSFLSQILPFTDSSLEKLFVCAKLLLRKLPVDQSELPVEVQRNIDMDSYRIQQITSGKIGLRKEAGELQPLGPKGPQIPSPGDLEPLSRIIKDLNDKYGTDFSEEDKVFIRMLEEQVGTNEGLKASVRINPKESVKMTFDHVINDVIQEMMDSNFKFYQQVTDNPAFRKDFFGWLFERFYRSNSSSNAEL